MPKVWNLGNTTVRNPNRLQEGLILLEKEFQGKLYGPEAESLYVKRLQEEGIIESKGTSPDWFGRKWRSAFVKLGFITDKFGKKYAKESKEINEKLELRAIGYEVTPSGYALIKAGDSIGAIDDVFSRQLIQHEIPSPIEGSFPKGRMKPFVFLLQILYKLHEVEKEGLNKFEIGAFLQVFRDHTQEEVDKTIEAILRYREERAKLDGKLEKKRYDKKTLIEAAVGKSIKADSLIDYGDTTSRYSKMSGLVTQQGSRLVLRSNKIGMIEGILKKEPVFIADKNSTAYLEKFYRGTELPTDDKAFALREIEKLAKEVTRTDKEIHKQIDELTEKSDIRVLERVRYQLIDAFAKSQEEKFAVKQGEDESIEQILFDLEALEKKKTKLDSEIIDRPAFLEWTVWRAFLAIDHITSPISLTRKFPLDEDLLPRHTAPSGVPDMAFEFEDHVLVVEVTLTTSSRQEAAEGEPVRRHIFNAKENTKKDVYGVFIAPTIDNNTAETFRLGVWYKNDLEESVNIVPFTMEQFHLIIRTLRKKRYMPSDFRLLIDKCLLHRKARAPVWKRAIQHEIDLWVNDLTNSRHHGEAAGL